MDENVNICHTYTDSGQFENIQTIDGQREDLVPIEDARGIDMVPVVLRTICHCILICTFILFFLYWLRIMYLWNNDEINHHILRCVTIVHLTRSTWLGQSDSVNLTRLHCSSIPIEAHYLKKPLEPLLGYQLVIYILGYAFTWKNGSRTRRQFFNLAEVAKKIPDSHKM